MRRFVVSILEAVSSDSTISPNARPAGFFSFFSVPLLRFRFFPPMKNGLHRLDLSGHLTTRALPLYFFSSVCTDLKAVTHPASTAFFSHLSLVPSPQESSRNFLSSGRLLFCQHATVDPRAFQTAQDWLNFAPFGGTASHQSQRLSRCPCSNLKVTDDKLLPFGFCPPHGRCARRLIQPLFCRMVDPPKTCFPFPVLLMYQPF